MGGMCDSNDFRDVRSMIPDTDVAMLFPICPLNFACYSMRRICTPTCST